MLILAAANEFGISKTKTASGVLDLGVEKSKINTNEIGLGDVKSPNPDVKIEKGQDVLLSSKDGMEVRLPNEGKFENVVADGKTAHLFTIDENGIKVVKEDTSIGGNNKARI